MSGPLANNAGSVCRARQPPFFLELNDVSVPNADVVIDARAMEPPEPFVTTMDALDTLPDGQRLLVMLNREPHPLYRALAKQGYLHETTVTDDWTFNVLIWRK